MHKLEFSIFKVAKLIEISNPEVSKLLERLASISHNYDEPQNINLDVPETIIANLHKT
jgi:hypothetical protein